MKEMTSVPMNGSCVRTMTKIRAGSSGARRAQSPAAGSPCGRRPCVATADVLAVVRCGAHFLPRLVALGDVLGEPLALVEGLVDGVFPAIAELTSWLTCVPRSGNSGMSTNWMPSAGRGCTPGFSGSADSMAALVGSANAPAP